MVQPRFLHPFFCVFSQDTQAQTTKKIKKSWNNANGTTKTKKPNTRNQPSRWHIKHKHERIPLTCIHHHHAIRRQKTTHDVMIVKIQVRGLRWRRDPYTLPMLRKRERSKWWQKRSKDIARMHQHHVIRWPKAHTWQATLKLYDENHEDKGVVLTSFWWI
jgi:hypothetical protein